MNWPSELPPSDSAERLIDCSSFFRMTRQTAIRAALIGMGTAIVALVMVTIWYLLLPLLTLTQGLVLLVALLGIGKTAKSAFDKIRSKLSTQGDDAAARPTTTTTARLVVPLTAIIFFVAMALCWWAIRSRPEPIVVAFQACPREQSLTPKGYANTSGPYAVQSTGTSCDVSVRGERGSHYVVRINTGLLGVLKLIAIKISLQPVDEDGRPVFFAHAAADGIENAQLLDFNEHQARDITLKPIRSEVVVDFDCQYEVGKTLDAPRFKIVAMSLFTEDPRTLLKQPYSILKHLLDEDHNYHAPVFQSSAACWRLPNLDAVSFFNCSGTGR